jgi:hypothetical protein
MAKEPSFAISAPDDCELARQIAARAAGLSAQAGRTINQIELWMDIVACHANGCPLDLDRLAQADDFNIAHDVFGISRHLDRETGELTDCFLPRFASKQRLAA